MSYQEQTTKDQTIGQNRDERLATHDLLETAAADGEFTRFLAAISASGLEDLLRGPSLLTVFAPVNKAFDEIGEDTGRSIDIAKIASIIRYHIVPGAITAAEAGAGQLLDTMEGPPVRISRENGELRVGGARILRADIECTNGVLHAIGRVLLP